ncbi:MAG TPA: glycosyltransferase family 39 protein, partial [Pirellulaceae bacterium]|nr:glycosyltransferase family 39 protein [Pirellulaceae bacterium]
MPSTVRQQLILIGLTAVVLFTNLGGPRLWDRDEPRNAGCAAEMLQRGDWVVPVFNNELRTHKPVLLYWLMMSAYEVFGVNEFAARFWSAMLGIATVLMTYHLGRRLFNERAGFWAGLSLAPALMFGVASRAATPDAVLVFCSTLALFLYGMFAFRAGGVANRYFPTVWWQAALIYAAMGLAILAKGPVGLVLPTAVIGMFLLIMRQPTSTLVTGDWFGSVRSGLGVFGPLHFLRTCWAMRPLTALAVSLAIALPWYLWVHARTEGAWTVGFFFEHNLGRATQAMEGHRGNLLFYPAALAIGFFPWSVFFLPMLLDAIDQLRRRVVVTPGYLFAACWVGVYLVLFSLAKTKLPSYITPCYPGVALLMGAFASNVITQQSRVALVWIRVSLATAVIVGVALLVGLPQVSARFLPGEEWLGVLGIAPLLAGLLGWYFTARQMFQRAMLTYGASAIAFSTFGLALVTQRVDEHQRNDELLAAIF